MSGLPGGGARLTGVTVVVTRPHGDVDDVADALRAAGATVVQFPVLEIADPEDGGAALRRAAAQLFRFEWVAFTSANAARRLLDLVPDPSALRGVHLAVVGHRTAAVLAAKGLGADLVPERASAEGLAEAFPPASAPGAAVLFPASASARPTLPQALRAKGWIVEQVVAYRTVPVAGPPAGRARDLEDASAVAFASPSAVQAYVSLRSRDGRPLPVPGIVACIGEVTAAAARAAGLRVAAIAAGASGVSLADALADALGHVREGMSAEASGHVPGGVPPDAPGDAELRPR
ncbi:MAG: uroporphyrinogen-III synthase [Acidimicrobiales bacterium]